jgi:hypothetical protein
MESSYIRPKYPENYGEGDTFSTFARVRPKVQIIWKFRISSFWSSRRDVSRQYVANMIYKFSYRKKGFFSSVRSTIELMRLEVPLRKMSTSRCALWERSMERVKYDGN